MKRFSAFLLFAAMLAFSVCVFAQDDKGKGKKDTIPNKPSAQRTTGKTGGTPAAGGSGSGTPNIAIDEGGQTHTKGTLKAGPDSAAPKKNPK